MKYVINLVLLLAMFQAKAEVVLRFKEHIAPEAQYVGDLLIITPDTHHWGKIRLDSQARNGEWLNKEQLMSWLHNKVGMFPYQWQGKRSVFIHQKTRSTAQELVDKAQTALANSLKEQAYAQVKLIAKSKPKDCSIPLEQFKIQLPKEYPTAKRICVQLRYQQHSIPLWFAVKAYQKVLVAQHRMKAQSLIHQGDVILQLRNIAGLKHKPLTQLPANLWLNHAINKNQILTQDDLSNTPEVIQGQKVKVNVQEQGISIIAEAEAQHNAYLGQEVRMKNLGTHKYFNATVIGKNRAEIKA
jgi:flagella basal body P-ring formation protein FlgA